MLVHLALLCAVSSCTHTLAHTLTLIHTTEILPVPSTSSYWIMNEYVLMGILILHVEGSLYFIKHLHMLYAT